MQIEYLSTSELKPYEGNPRIHNEKQIEKLISSIQEYGFVLPVLIDRSEEHTSELQSR